MPPGRAAPASRGPRHASVQFGAKKIANKGQSEAHACPTPPAALSTPSEPSPAPAAARPGVERGGGACQLAALDDAAAARGTAQTATKLTSAHHDNVDGARKPEQWQP